MTDLAALSPADRIAAFKAAKAAGPTDPAIVQELAAFEARTKAAKDGLAAVTARKAAVADEPGYRLQLAQLEALAAERATRLAQHELDTDAVYRAALVERGEGMLVRLRTSEGSVVVRCESEMETDDRIDELQATQARADQATTPKTRDDILHMRERAHRERLIGLVLSDHAHFRALAGKHHGIWGAVSKAVVDLVNARERAEGKDSAG